jgi:dTDP-4-dehydrorhamnose reductase
MRIVVTGRKGQVVTSLIERSAGRAEIIPLGRPDLDLKDPASVSRALEGAMPDIIINAAAYTAVDKAEQEPDEAMRVNADGAGFIAAASVALNAPLIHLSTDYVFDGALPRPYVETDETGPTGAYGRSKLEGEARVQTAQPNAVILRTAWVYSPFSANFLRTMLRLGETRDEVSVVADQFGNPTSAIDIADAVLTIAARLHSDSAPDLRGVFHMTGAGEASWADFAEAILGVAEQCGRKPVRVKRITTADYPTLAKRPSNSRLDCGKLTRRYGVTLPHWERSIDDCVRRVLSSP